MQLLDLMKNNESKKSAQEQVPKTRINLIFNAQVDDDLSIGELPIAIPKKLENRHLGEEQIPAAQTSEEKIINKNIEILNYHRHHSEQYSFPFFLKLVLLYQKLLEYLQP